MSAAELVKLENMQQDGSNKNAEIEEETKTRWQQLNCLNYQVCNTISAEKMLNLEEEKIKYVSRKTAQIS